MAPIPVADIKKGDYPDEEIRFRNKLASLGHLCAHYGWTEGIYNHISCRLDQADQFLLSPFPLMFNEITGGSLIRMDMNQEILDSGTLRLGINNAGANLHSSIFKARPDISCIIHLHTEAVTAISTMDCEVMPISQPGMQVGAVAYHDYEGIVNDIDEKDRFTIDLGDRKVMILRNHGFITCGRTIEEAFNLCYNLVLACEVQIRAMAAGATNTMHMHRGAAVSKIIRPSKDALKKYAELAEADAGGVLKYKEDSVLKGTVFKMGAIEWEGFMRMLDQQGHQTGHEYRIKLPEHFTNDGVSCKHENGV